MDLDPNYDSPARDKDAGVDPKSHDPLSRVQVEAKDVREAAKDPLSNNPDGTMHGEDHGRERFVLPKDKGRSDYGHAGTGGRQSAAGDNLRGYHTSAAASEALSPHSLGYDVTPKPPNLQVERVWITADEDSVVEADPGWDDSVTNDTVEEADPGWEGSVTRKALWEASSQELASGEVSAATRMGYGISPDPVGDAVVDTALSDLKAPPAVYITPAGAPGPRRTAIPAPPAIELRSLDDRDAYIDHSEHYSRRSSVFAAGARPH
jgi:hypothetical protein